MRAMPARYGRPPQLWRHTGLLERHLREVNAFIAVSAFSRAKHHEFGFPRDMEVIPGFVRDPGPPRARAQRGAAVLPVRRPDRVA